MKDGYEEQGFGATRTGFGERPAVLVVDFQRGFTDPAQPLGGSPLVDAAVEATARLLRAARASELPVLQTYVAHQGEADALRWKIPAVISELRVGSPAAELDPRTFDPSHDLVVRKIAPSIFFGTPAAAILTRLGVDTAIVTGCNTSGCVRASVVDAFSHGFRVIVPRECCGDVERGPHEDSLRDVGRRYADVVGLDEVLAALAGYAAASRVEPLAGRASP